jgi:DNA-binding response OmpR family regulator
MSELEKRILVVDDDDAIRALLFTVLRRRGFLVDTARDGALAMEMLDRCAYVLVLLDLMMPRRSGWEVMDHLALRPPELRPLIIVLTAGTEPRSFAPGMVALTVRKPFDIELLVDTVSACLSTIDNCEQAGGCPEPESRVPDRANDTN